MGMLLLSDSITCFFFTSAPPTLPAPLSCGITSSQGTRPFIVGGNDALVGEVPWQVGPVPGLPDVT